MPMVPHFPHSYSLDHFLSLHALLLGVTLKYTMVKISSWNLIAISLTINCDKCSLIIKGSELHNEPRIVHVRAVYNPIPRRFIKNCGPLGGAKKVQYNGNCSF